MPTPDNRTQRNNIPPAQLALGRMSLLIIQAAARDASSPGAMARLSSIDWLSSQDDGFVSCDSACQNVAEMVEQLPLTIQAEIGQSLEGNQVDLAKPESWHVLIDKGLEGDQEALQWLSEKAASLIYDGLEAARIGDVTLLSTLEAQHQDATQENRERSLVSKSNDFGM